MSTITAADDLSSHRTRSNVRRTAQPTPTPESDVLEIVVTESTDRELVGA